MTRLRASREAIGLAHPTTGAVFLYHQRYGYILEMSRDVYELWASFQDGADRTVVAAEHAESLSGQPPAELIDVLCEFSCLLDEASEGDEAWLDYVPVKGAWNVWDRAADADAADAVTLWTAWGARPVARHPMSPVETAIWDAIDGERRVGELAARFGEAVTLPLLLRLASIEVQAIKLTPMPLSVYGGRHRWPSYLTSTMPYPPIASAGGDAPSLLAYHAAIGDPDRQFDEVETTLAHLFRKPHPALGDRRYGEALLAGLEKRGLVLGPEPLRVVEIGGGLGEMAAAINMAVQARGFALDYQILELSPALAERQRQRAGVFGVRVLEGDAASATIVEGSLDLIIANEMIGDLPVVPRSEADGLVEKYGLDVDGADGATPINSGAIEMLARLSDWMAPGGMAILTEFGDRSRFARLSSHLDHPEHSIHFGHLESVATHHGLEAELVFVIDLIEMRRELRGLATTRSQFRALAAMLGSRGVVLEKIGYTAEMFDALTASVSAPRDDGEAHFGDIRFDRIEDRLMGLVPHEFKALICRKP